MIGLGFAGKADKSLVRQAACGAVLNVSLTFKVGLLRASDPKPCSMV